MKELIILTLLVSGLALAIVYETNKSVEKINKIIHSTYNVESKN